MAVFKCKMCGGDLHPDTESTTCECEFCGTVQTVPSDAGEKKTNLFNRANRLRMNAEFDKAAAVYESIAAEYPEEAEAYWGLCLCAYGIEYVDDPATGEKKPTCHRTLPTSIMEDVNFEQACDNADAIARRVYREEAKAIDRIQKDILSIVANEAPYDVFICYKETAEEGGRTEDSVLAQEIYDALTGKGLKVFFSRITLEDKLGQQYEPYIYAALSSAKIMLAVGTKFEYYDAVWVKNEWMRFLSMMKTEKGKTLIPCYKGIDAYDMPKEFKNLQGQDMGKLGWLQDLTRGVEKLLGPKNEQQSKTADPSATQVDTFIKRAWMFIESGEWDKAIEYCEKVLDINPENSQAYFVKELAERKCTGIPDLAKFFYLHGEIESDSLKKARRFANSETQAQLDDLKEKTKTAPDDMKKTFADDLARERGLPDWKEKKERLEYVRNQFYTLKDRTLVQLDQTFLLNTDGKMFCTKLANDEGRGNCNSWTTRLNSFICDGRAIIGCTTAGKVIRTPATKADQYGTYTSNWSTVSHWPNVKELEPYTFRGIGLGLMQDGTVKSVGKFAGAYHGQDKVDHLHNIASIHGYNAWLDRNLFLSKDGTVQSSQFIGEDKNADVWEDMSKWTDIKEIISFGPVIAGLRSDGTVVCTRYMDKDNPIYYDGTKEMAAWTGVVHVELCSSVFLGLTETGRVLATDYYSEKDPPPGFLDTIQAVKKWTDIAVLVYTYDRIIGLTVDGAIKCTDYLGTGNRYADEQFKYFPFWKNIASFRMTDKTFIGILRNGSLIETGTAFTNVSELHAFRDFDRIPDEISEGETNFKAEQAKEKEQREKRTEQNRAEDKKRKEALELAYEKKLKDIKSRKDAILNELSHLGLFSGKRKKELEEKFETVRREEEKIKGLNDEVKRAQQRYYGRMKELGFERTHQLEIWRKFGNIDSCYRCYTWIDDGKLWEIMAEPDIENIDDLRGTYQQPEKIKRLYYIIADIDYIRIEGNYCALRYEGKDTNLYRKDAINVFRELIPEKVR